MNPDFKTLVNFTVDMQDPSQKQAYLKGMVEGYVTGMTQLVEQQKAAVDSAIENIEPLINEGLLAAFAEECG